MPTEELFGNYHFLLEIAGTTLGRFLGVEVHAASKVTALKMDTITKASSHSAAVKKIPGRLKWQDITLKRGLTGPSKFGDITLKRGIVGGAAGAPPDLKWRGAAQKTKIPGMHKVGDVTLKRGVMGAAQKIPGRLKWADVTLKKGATSGQQSLNLAATQAQGSELTLVGFQPEEGSRAGRLGDTAQSGQIVLVNEQGVPVARWHFTNAWPSKWEGPSQKADSDGGDVTIYVERLQKA